MSEFIDDIDVSKCPRCYLDKLKKPACKNLFTGQHNNSCKPKENNCDFYIRNIEQLKNNGGINK